MATLLKQDITIKTNSSMRPRRFSFASGGFASFETLRGSIPDFEFLDDAQSPTEEFDFNGFRASLLLKTDYVNRFILARQIMGGIIDLGGGFYEVQRPWFYGSPVDLITGVIPYAVATRVRIVPFGRRVNLSEGVNKARPDHAVLQVQFETVEWENAAGDANSLFVTEEFSGSTEFLTRDRSNLFWSKDDGTQPPDLTLPDVPQDIIDKYGIKPIEAPGHLIQISVWNVTFHRVSRINPLIFSWGGKVNEKRHWSPRIIGPNDEKLSFEKQELLAAAPIIRREHHIDGFIANEVSFSFANVKTGIENDTSKPNGWNKFYGRLREEPSAIYNRTDNGEANATVDPWFMYDLADFSSVLPTLDDD